MNPVSDSFRDSIRGHYDRITIPTIWIAFVLSLLFHAMALIGWLPRVLSTPFEDPKPGKTSGSLSVRLAPLPSPARVSPAAPAAAASAPAVAPRTAAREKPRERPVERPPAASPPVLALERPAAAAVAPPRAEAERAPAYTDLAAYIAARRGARGSAAATDSAAGGQQQAPAETEQERHNRVVAENLGLNRTPAFGADLRPGGGIFQVQRMNYYDAEFLFFGWNKDIRRNAQQKIEVRRGDNSSMELAVVRRMIEIIRDHAKDDFVWESVRLGREITLSLRPTDRAGLETFLMREFFPALR